MKIEAVEYLGVTPTADAAARDALALFAGCGCNDHESARVSVRSVITKSDPGVTVATKLSITVSGSKDGQFDAVRKSPCSDEDEVKAVNRLVRLNVLQLMSEATGIKPGPWGILRGVRPTKIVHKQLDVRKRPAEILRFLEQDYAVAADKAALLLDIALRGRRYLPVCGQPDRSISLYIGIPFCPTRCLYCSFPASVLPSEAEVAVFLAALRRDMQSAAASIAAGGWKVQSIYIGGGTPTSLGETNFRRLLADVEQLFFEPSTVEFTVEAGRPDTITEEKISAMCEHKVTRVSVNPQTMQEKTLKRIGRNHSVQDIITIFGKIRHAAPFLINMDLIAGLPGETVEDMADTLRQIGDLAPDNLTVHTLAVKKGSVLKETGCNFVLPDEAVVKKMLDGASRAATEMGLYPYYLYRQKYMTGNFENVGYARQGADCLYNIQIIEERQTIIGIGPGSGTKAVDLTALRLKSHYHPKDLRSYLAHLDMHLLQRGELLAECAQNG